MLVYAALTAIVFCVYRGAFAVYFLSEDFSWLWRCRLVAPTTVWTLVTRDVMLGLYSWRPLLQLSFGLNEALWGVDPFGYRCVGLAWHALAACALYALVAQIADRWRAALAAVFFAVHPVHVESLSWTCAAGGPISTACLLLAFLGYVHWRRGGGWWTVLVPYVLAVAVLESSVVFLGLLLAADLCVPLPVLRRGRRLQLYAVLLTATLALLWLRSTGSPAAMSLNVVGIDPHWAASIGQLAIFALHKFQAMAALLLACGAQPGWLSAAVAVLMVLAATCCAWRGRWLGVWGFSWIVVAGAPFTLLLLGPFPRHLHLAAVGCGLLLAELVATATELVGRRHRQLGVACVAGLTLLWLGYMGAKIDQTTAEFAERGRLSAALLDELHQLVPQPRPGSTLAFYRMGDLRVQQHVFVYGFEDAVRLLYGDGTLDVQMGPQGSLPHAAYQLAYQDGALILLGGEAP